MSGPVCDRCAGSDGRHWNWCPVKPADARPMREPERAGIPPRPGPLRRVNGTLTDHEGKGYVASMEMFAPGNRAQALADHEHAVAKRAVEALQKIFLWDDRSSKTSFKQIALDAADEITASGWRP